MSYHHKGSSLIMAMSILPAETVRSDSSRVQHSCDEGQQYLRYNKASCLKATQSVPVATQRASPSGCAAADPLFLLCLAPLRSISKARKSGNTRNELKFCNSADFYRFWPKCRAALL